MVHAAERIAVYYGVNCLTCCHLKVWKQPATCLTQFFLVHSTTRHRLRASRTLWNKWQAAKWREARHADRRAKLRFAHGTMRTRYSRNARSPDNRTQRACFVAARWHALSGQACTLFLVAHKPKNVLTSTNGLIYGLSCGFNFQVNQFLKALALTKR